MANASSRRRNIARVLPNTAATEATVATSATEISTPAWDRCRSGQVTSQASIAPPAPHSSAVPMMAKMWLIVAAAIAGHEAASIR